MLEGIALRDLILQIIYGADLNPPFWFLSTMLCIYILFYFVFLFFKNDSGICIIIGICAFSIYMQYSGKNYFMFVDFPEYCKWTIGRFNELIPIAGLGVIMSYYNVMNILNRHRKVAIISSLLGCIIVTSFDLFQSCAGYYYQGIMYIFLPAFISIIFYLLPGDRIPQMIQNGINFCSGYTIGIIGFHFLVRTCLVMLLGNANRLSLGWSFIVYVISFLLSLLGGIIPIKMIRECIT